MQHEMPQSSAQLLNSWQNQAVQTVTGLLSIFVACCRRAVREILACAETLMALQQGGCSTRHQLPVASSSGFHRRAFSVRQVAASCQIDPQPAPISVDVSQQQAYECRQQRRSLRTLTAISDQQQHCGRAERCYQESQAGAAVGSFSPCCASCVPAVELIQGVHTHCLAAGLHMRRYSYLSFSLLGTEAQVATALPSQHRSCG